MTTHKELAELILAFDRGEKVECKREGIVEHWQTDWYVVGDVHEWSTSSEYRIVKQPVKRKAECWEDGTGEYRWLSPEAGKVENAYFKRIPALDREWTEGE